MIQYAAAIFRKASHPEEHQYAIIQTYGYMLGNSSRPKGSLKQYSLKYLESQDLQTLNFQSVVLG